MPSSTIRHPKSAADASDRRRSPRRPHVIEAWIASPTATDERLEVMSVNISRHGVAFCIERDLPLGAYYVIEIGMGPQRIVSEIRTVSSKPVDGDRFEVGAEFV
jgi:hypothetical protein